MIPQPLFNCCAQDRRGAAGLRAAIVELGFNSITQFVDSAYKVHLNHLREQAEAAAARRRALSEARLNAGQ